MDWTVIVGCGCLLAGFGFGVAVGGARRDLRELRDRPIIADPIDITRPPSRRQSTPAPF